MGIGLFDYSVLRISVPELCMNDDPRVLRAVGQRLHLKSVGSFDRGKSAQISTLSREGQSE